MSAIGKAIGKVFKGVVGIVKKVWKPLLIAAAVYFTAGALAPVFAGAGGAAAAVGGDVAAGAADAAATGGALGAGVASDFAAGAAGDLGAGVAADVGGSVAADTGAGLLGGAADTAGAASAAQSTGILADAGGAADGGALSAAQSTGVMTNGGAGSALSAAGGNAGGGGSLWSSALSATKTILGTPGIPTLIGGIAQGAMQANAMNAQLKYMDAHAPGQISGGVKGAFNGFSTPSNMTPKTAAPTANSLPQFASLAKPGSTPEGVPSAQQPLPGQNSPASPSYGMPGYGMPGYGQQTPGYAYNPNMEQGQQPYTTPFMESPYDGQQPLLG